MSHRPQIESLEKRTLMAATIAEMQFPPDWPELANNPGVTRIGRTIFIKGTPQDDHVQILTTTLTVTGLDVPANRLVEFRVARVMAPVLFTGRIRRILIDVGDGNDRVDVADNLPPTFHPRKIVIRGGAGNDRLVGGTRANTILGEEGDDELIGRNANDILIGGNGNDVLTGAGGNDRFFGLGGDDRFVNAETAAEQPSGTRDILDGGTGGNDTAQADPGDRRRNIENNNAP